MFFILQRGKHLPNSKEYLIKTYLNFENGLVWGRRFGVFSDSKLAALVLTLTWLGTHTSHFLTRCLAVIRSL